ncbi:uncharacterized protein METZ01_LOCUS394669, partial [marine metagenome]
VPGRARRHHPHRVGPGHGHQRQGRVLGYQSYHPRDAEGRRRFHRKHLFHLGNRRPVLCLGRVQRLQRCGAHLHQVHCHPVRAGGHPGQLHSPRPHRHPNDRLPPGRPGGGGRVHRPRSHRPHGPTRRRGLWGAIPGVGRIIVRNGQRTSDRRRLPSPI